MIFINFAGDKKLLKKRTNERRSCYYTHIQRD